MWAGLELGRSGDCVLAAVDRADALAWAQRDVADAPPLHRRCSGVKGSQGNCARLPFCVCEEKEEEEEEEESSSRRRRSRRRRRNR